MKKLRTQAVEDGVIHSNDNVPKQFSSRDEFIQMVSGRAKLAVAPLPVIDPPTGKASRCRNGSGSSRIGFPIGR